MNITSFMIKRATCVQRHSMFLLRPSVVRGASGPLSALSAAVPTTTAMSGRRSFSNVVVNQSLIMRRSSVGDALINGRLGAARRTFFASSSCHRAEQGEKKTNTDESEPEQAFYDQYSRPLQWLHLFGALGITFCVMSALVAGNIDPKTCTEEEKKFRGKLMHLHESVGVLMLICMAPRLGARLLTKLPRELPVPGIQAMASKVMHASLYGIIVFMPVSGVAFGVASAWGVPFFSWEIPGISKELYASDPKYKKIEDFFYTWHHNVGYVLTYYILPAHVGAVIFHRLFQGHNLLIRMNPFRRRN